MTSLIAKFSSLLALASTFAMSNSFAVPAVLAETLDKDKESGVDIVSLSHTTDTDAAIAFCREGISTIPLSVQNKIAAADIKVVVTPRTIYDEPDKSGQQVFTNGGTTDNAGGMFESGKKRVLIPERSAWRNSPPHFQGRYLVGVVRHELGHAFDYASGGISRQAEYMRVYKQDLSRLSSSEKIKFSYYIIGVSKEKSEEGTASGRCELFASLFAAICTNPPSAKDQILLTAFPNVKDYILGLDSELRSVPANTKVSTEPAQKSKPVMAPSPEQAAKSEPNPELDHAAELIKSAHYGKAIGVLNGIIRANHDDQRAHLLRGNALSWLGRYREAIYDYNAAIRLDRQNAESYLMRGRAYGWLGRKLDEKHDEETAERIKAGQQIKAP